MKRPVKPIHVLSIVVSLGVLFLAVSSCSAAPSLGNLSGLVLDETGQPLSDVFVSLLQGSDLESLPTLTRTNEAGRIHLTDLEAGVYQISVRNSNYRSPVRRLVEIVPDRTSVITLILQQVFGFEESAQSNMSLKALLRSRNDRRLIFRHIPVGGGFGQEQPPQKLFEDAVFQIFTNAGSGSDYFVFPGDSWGGTSTNFAVSDSVSSRSDYIFAGQLNSGQDSIWRFKNLLNYELDGSHSIKLFFGYSRISYDQPSLALLTNPVNLKDNVEFASAPATSRLLSVGFEEQVGVGPALTLTWGVELDQFRGQEIRSFASPKAEVAYSPLEGTSLKLALTSKRSTLGNSITLPDGRQVSLASPVYLSMIGDEMDLGVSRHYEGSLSQALGDKTEVEVARFDSSMAGGVVPILAVFESQASAEVLSMPGENARSQGFRVSLGREFSEMLKARVSYVSGTGPGLDTDRMTHFSNVGDLIRHIERRHFHGVSAQVDAYVPSSQTQVTALLKFVPSRDPLTTLDALTDVYETGNEGVNLFVRQVVPLPAALLGFLGLEFLAPNRVEVLLDIRNLLDEDIGVVQTPAGEVALVQNPRSVRGGLSVRF